MFHLSDLSIAYLSFYPPFFVIVNLGEFWCHPKGILGNPSSCKIQVGEFNEGAIHQKPIHFCKHLSIYRDRPFEFLPCLACMASQPRPTRLLDLLPIAPWWDADGLMGSLCRCGLCWDISKHRYGKTLKHLCFH